MFHMHCALVAPRLARMEGAWRASAEVVVFLDSHIEAKWHGMVLMRQTHGPIDGVPL